MNRILQIFNSGQSSPIIHILFYPSRFSIKFRSLLSHELEIFSLDSPRITYETQIKDHEYSIPRL